MFCSSIIFWRSSSFPSQFPSKNNGCNTKMINLKLWFWFSRNFRYNFSPYLRNIDTKNLPSLRDVLSVQALIEFRMKFRASKFFGADNVITNMKIFSLLDFLFEHSNDGCAMNRTSSSSITFREKRKYY